MNPNENDLTIDEIREVRMRISDRFGHKPQDLVAHYIALQKQFADRLIETPRAVRQEDQPAG